MNGLGLVNTTKAKIKDGKEYDHLFPAAQNKITLIRETVDIISVVDDIQIIVSETLYQTEKIAPILQGRNLHETLYNVWKFGKDYFNYAEEDDEQLREPAKSWQDRFTGIDCDCYTILCSSILCNLGIKHTYRLAKYSSDTFQHIYIIVIHNELESSLIRSNYIVLDCVKDSFNLEHPYTGKPKDIMNKLEVYRLSGIQQNMEIVPTGFANEIMAYAGLGADSTTTTTAATGAKEEKSLFENPLVWLAIIAIGGFLVWKSGILGGSKKGVSGLSGPKKGSESKYEKLYREQLEKEKKAAEQKKIQKIKDEANDKVAKANARARNAKKG